LRLNDKKIILLVYLKKKFTFAKLLKFIPISIMNHYETVFILNPVLSDVQVKETVSKFEEFLTSRGAEMISKEDWGLKKMAYEIQNKKSGFYHLFEFKVAGEVLIAFETEFRRDERVMRFLTVSLDKHAISWAERRRTKLKAAKAN
jgi:small subunit ribosomal protein S6